MSLFTALDLASSGMHVQRIRMNVASMNVANKDTTSTEQGGPYRRRDVHLKTVRNDDAFSARLRQSFEGEPSAYLKVEVDRIEESQDPLQKIYDPHHPDADEQGYVELPNVSALHEMLNIMSASRAYEAGTNIMRTVKHMAESAMRIGQS